MKSLVLKPTYENLLDSLKKDSIGRNFDVGMFAEIINSATDSCCISLDASWGAGKTFFVKQTKMLLDSYNPLSKSIKEDDRDLIKSVCKTGRNNEIIPHVCVYYDVWENDNDDDPILSLIYSIINTVGSSFSFSDEVDVFSKAATILEFFSGKNWKDVVETLKGTSPFDEIKRKKEIQEEIKEFFDSLLAECGERLVVFIDELDRCKPSYAVKLLERIKHYFDNDRITFVFSINTLELQHTIKKYYGDDFDACRYLDRFFDLRITLPKPNYSKFYSIIGFDDSNYVFDDMCRRVIQQYSFSLREISKYIRITKMAAYDLTHNKNKFSFSFLDGKSKSFCILYLIPLMIGLNLFKRDLYEEFISGKNFEPLISLLSGMDTYWFDELLSNDETFDKDDSNKTMVSFEQKLIDVYNALFAKNYDDHNSCTKVGKYTFIKGTKDILFQIVGLLSQFTNTFSESEDENNG